jgi:hypothetical protein
MNASNVRLYELREANDRNQAAESLCFHLLMLGGKSDALIAVVSRCLTYRWCIEDFFASSYSIDVQPEIQSQRFVLAKSSNTWTLTHSEVPVAVEKMDEPRIVAMKSENGILLDPPQTFAQAWLG